LTEAERKAEENYLVFEAGGFPLALRISQVVKVLDKQAAQPGTENLNLAEMLGAKTKKSEFRLELLVKDKIKSAAVDKVEPIKNLRLAIWLDFPGLMRRKHNQIIEGFFFDGSRMISLINLERLE